MSDFVPNQIIYDVFHEYASTVGLVQSDFTVRLYKDGAMSGIPVTITGIGNGQYRVSFTPNSNGVWSVDIVRTSDDAARYGGSYVVRDPAPTLEEVAGAVWEAIADDHIADPASFGAYLNKVKKYTTNKLTQTGNTYSVKEDDGVTEFESGTTTETERSPN